MMKFCPYCGAELANCEAPFCSECGKPLSGVIPENAKTEAEKKPIKRKPGRKRRKVKKKEQHLPTASANPSSASDEYGVSSQDDGYDGYYDDVLPLDEGSCQEGVDKELVKKIVALVIGVLVIVAACVALMYLL